MLRISPKRCAIGNNMENTLYRTRPLTPAYPPAKVSLTQEDNILAKQSLNILTKDGHVATSGLLEAASALGF